MRSIRDAFVELASANPDAVAIVDAQGRVCSRAALLDTSSAIARRLRGAGLRSADRLAAQLPNSVDFVATFLAALELRLTFVPLDRDARETEVANVLSHFGARGLAYGSGSPTNGALPSISIRENVAESEFEYVALIKQTSGSTGMPKGIATREANLIADCANICSSMSIHSDDVNFAAIPLSHSYGFSNLVMPLLLQGTAMVISNEYLPLSVLEICNRHRCTVLPGIPMMFDHLSQLPRSDGEFSTVRTFISAGAPLPAAVSRRFRERFRLPIHTFYGCSECGGISYDREGAAVERGSVGAPMDNVTIVVDEKSHRLTIESDAVAAGFIGAIEPDTRFSPRRFVTDDLGTIDDDGELRLEGRIGDLINTAGKKVNPREVELVLLQIEGVRAAVVYGEPAGARGEVVAAVVVADGGVTRESVREYCRLHLSAHKVPRIVKLREQIPVDERGKIKRSTLALL